MIDCVHPCGYFSDPQKSYTCTPADVTQYQKWISSALLDRIEVAQLIMKNELGTELGNL
jgi:predicted ATPase with chaperone activity